MAEPRHVDLEEFRETGYLQELNRRFLHPLGLHLQVVVDARTGKALEIDGIFDYRSNPEGVDYGKPPDPEKAARVEREWERRAKVRQEALGWIVQPLKGEDA